MFLFCAEIVFEQKSISNNMENSDEKIDSNPKEDAGQDENKEMLEKAEEEKKVTFDDILKQIGQFGRYQKRIYFLLFLPTIFCAMHKLAWVFLGKSWFFREIDNIFDYEFKE